MPLTYFDTKEPLSSLGVSLFGVSGCKGHPRLCKAIIFPVESLLNLRVRSREIVSLNQEQYSPVGPLVLTIYRVRIAESPSFRVYLLLSHISPRVSFCFSLLVYSTIDAIR